MNEIEKQRQELLNRTRTIYNEKKQPPAIHPRYQGMYHSLYEKRETSTFVLRLTIAITIFLIFFAANNQNVDIGFVNNEKVIAAVQEDLFREKFPLFIKQFKFFQNF